MSDIVSRQVALAREWIISARLGSPKSSFRLTSCMMGESPSRTRDAAVCCPTHKVSGGNAWCVRAKCAQTTRAKRRGKILRVRVARNSPPDADNRYPRRHADDRGIVGDAKASGRGIIVQRRRRDKTSARGSVYSSGVCTRRRRVQKRVASLSLRARANIILSRQFGAMS